MTRHHQSCERQPGSGLPLNGCNLPDQHEIDDLNGIGQQQDRHSVESYRVVDDVLMITGKDYVINAKYSVEGKRMIVVASQLKVVLEEVE